jgi:antirestriction protein
MHETEPDEKDDENEDTEGGRPESQPKLKPRIYVASLSDYNAGRLHGVWLDADVETETLAHGVRAMLSASPEPSAEEFAIHDYEAFGPLRLGEFESLGSVSRIGRGIAEYGQAFAHWAALVGTDSEALERFEESYRGHYASLAAYVEEVIDDMGVDDDIDKAVPEFLAPYVHINVEAFGRDLEQSGDITASSGEGGVYIFDGTV